jgi:hypothetical protein
MARRRVFNTKVECPGIDFKTKRRLATGQTVTLQKSASGSEVQIALDERTVVGRLDPAIGVQVASAIDCGQSFTASIENAYQLSSGTTWIHLKVSYLLDHNQPAIEIPKVPVPEPAGEWKSFYTNVAGVTHRNPDGSDRQGIVSCCPKGERVNLIREPDNPYDSFAVKVVRANGEQIGYLPAHVVRNEGGGWNVARCMDRGCKYIAQVSSVTGGGGMSYGLNLQVTFWNGPLAIQPIGEPELPPVEPPRATSTVAPKSGCLTLLCIAALFIMVVLRTRQALQKTVPTPCIEALFTVASIAHGNPPNPL